MLYDKLIDEHEIIKQSTKLRTTNKTKITMITYQWLRQKHGKPTAKFFLKPWIPNSVPYARVYANVLGLGKT